MNKVLFYAFTVSCYQLISNLYWSNVFIKIWYLFKVIHPIIVLSLFAHIEYESHLTSIVILCTTVYDTCQCINAFVDLAYQQVRGQTLTTLGSLIKWHNLTYFIFRSPEMVLGNVFSESIDMWALACILIELHRGRIMFIADTPYDLLVLITMTLGAAPTQMLKHGIHVHDYYTETARNVFNMRVSYKPSYTAIQQQTCNRHTTDIQQ